MTEATFSFTGTPTGRLIQPKKALVAIFWYVTALIVGVLAFAAGAGIHGLLFSQLGGVLFVGLCYLLARRSGAAGKFIGRFGVKDLALGVGAVAFIYAAALLAQKALDIPQEAMMASLFQDRTALEVFSILVVVLVLAPVGEELAMRHFFLGAFDWRRNVRVATCAVVASSGVFALIHIGQYDNKLSLLVIFAVGVVAGYLRIRSDGLLLPMIVHGCAGGCALIVNLLL
ncbi:lysostaphin resistance A-like protein [Pseudomonas sp. NCHU5208]|uniref:CPBP family intramembrane glutamic endopeptidase n=1 Tax=unclassified Pseudomonas TaxID=196821 RepID=UPI003F96D353